MELLHLGDLVLLFSQSCRRQLGDLDEPRLRVFLPQLARPRERHRRTPSFARLSH